MKITKNNLLFMILYCTPITLFSMESTSKVPQPSRWITRIIDRFIGNWEGQLDEILAHDELTQKDKESDRLELLLNYVLIKNTKNMDCKKITSILAQCEKHRIPISSDLLTAIKNDAHKQVAIDCLYEFLITLDNDNIDIEQGKENVQEIVSEMNPFLQMINDYPYRKQ